jgi:uncharacterized membrane protein
VNELIYKVALSLHIGGGALALVCGPLAMAVTKGMRVHRFAGRVFVGAMLTVAVTAFYLSVVKPNPFLFVVAGFSMYMAGSGFRLARARRKTGAPIAMLDWLLTTAMAVFALGMFAYGGTLLSRSNAMGTVLLVFAAVAGLFVVQDVRYYRTMNGLGNARLRLHIGRMIGATISAYTAFLVVNNTVLPGLVAWLGPTVLGVPFMVYWSAKYSRKKL